MDKLSPWACLVNHLNGDEVTAMKFLRMYEKAYCGEVLDAKNKLSPEARFQRIFTLARILKMVDKRINAKSGVG